MIAAPEQGKYIIDAISTAAWVTAVTGAITGVIGVFAAVASFVWFLIRIYETKTVRRWLNRDHSE